MGDGGEEAATVGGRLPLFACAPSPMSRGAEGPRLRHVLVTGAPGVGKTTLVRRLVQQLLTERSVPMRGFYTEEVRGGAGEGGTARRIGFDVVTLRGRRAPLSRLSTAAQEKSCHSPRVGKYAVQLSSFESLALPELGRDAAESTLLVVDEIGKMELLSHAFQERIERLFFGSDDKSPSSSPPLSAPVVLATVPLPRYGRTIELVERLKARDDVRLHHVRAATRHEALRNALADVRAALQAANISPT